MRIRRKELMEHESSVLDYASPQHRPARKANWPLRVAGLLVVAAILAMVLPTLTTSEVRPVNTICLNNLRQIALAVIMYQSDHRGAYPPTLAETYSYIRHPRSYVCPVSGDTPLPVNTPKTQPAVGLLRPGACSYVYLGPALPAKPSPPAILLHERQPFHKGKMCIAYTDGTARTVDAKETAYILSELAAGHNPPRKR